MLGFGNSNTWRFTHSVVACHVPGAILSEEVTQPLAPSSITLRGVTKPQTLKTTLIGTGPGPKGETRTGAEATGTIKRSDFDVKAFLPAVSDEVDLIIAVEAIKE